MPFLFDKIMLHNLPNKMTFSGLMKEIPALDSHPFETQERKQHLEADKKAGGSNLFKGQLIRYVVECTISNK